MRKVTDSDRTAARPGWNPPGNQEAVHNEPNTPLSRLRSIRMAGARFCRRIRNERVFRAAACLILVLIIALGACAAGILSLLARSTRSAAPFDLSIQNRVADVNGGIDFNALLQGGGLDPEQVLAWQRDIRVHYNEETVTGLAEASGVISVSDYNALMARQGLPSAQKDLPFFPETQEGLANGGINLQIAVVSDEVAEQLPLRRQIWCADFSREWKDHDQVMAALEVCTSEPGIYLTARQDIRREIRGTAEMLLCQFLSLVIAGVIALMAALSMDRLRGTSAEKALPAVFLSMLLVLFQLPTRLLPLVTHFVTQKMDALFNPATIALGLICICWLCIQAVSRISRRPEERTTQVLFPLPGA